MIHHAAPLVRFCDSLVNLAHIDHVRIVTHKGQDNRGYPKTVYRMTITFAGTQTLWWTYDSKPDALAALEQFQQLIETYVMAELP